MYKILKEFRPELNKHNYFARKRIIPTTWTDKAYCPYCLKSMEITNRRWDNFGIYCYEFSCSNCNKTIFAHYDVDDEWNKTYINDKWNVVLYGSYAFVNYACVKYYEEKGLLAMFLSIDEDTFTRNFLKYDTTFVKLVMNLKTHNSYIIKRDKKGKITIKNVNNVYTRINFYNDYSWAINREIIADYSELFIEKYCELTGCNNAGNFDDIILDNRYRFFYRYLPEDFNSINECPSNVRKYIPREDIDYLEWVEQMVVDHNLPYTKSFKKLYFENILNVLYTIYFKQMGFTNPNIILTLLKVNRERDFYYPDYCQFSYIFKTRLIKKMIKKRGEVNVSRDIIRTDMTYIYDTIKMYEQIWKTNKKLLDKSLYSLSLKKAHDKLFPLHIASSFRSDKIKYPKKQKELIATYDTISFELPNETADLEIVGSDMNICVGSYGDKATSKKCIIVFMRDNGNNVGCIELDRNFNLIQVKAKSNYPLDYRYKFIFEQWAREHHINYSNCRDYLNIKDPILIENIA